ncbi:coagulation factor VIII, partial [Paramuricea clavata]
IFNGNSDRDTVVWNTLYPRVFTRVVRIHPKMCYDNCSLRAEFLGCYKGKFKLT